MFTSQTMILKTCTKIYKTVHSKCNNITKLVLIETGCKMQATTSRDMDRSFTLYRPFLHVIWTVPSRYMDPSFT